MIKIQAGKVREIISEEEKITEVSVQIGENVERAINLKELTGKIKVGDTVLLNTTAVALKLGSGGSHIIMGIVAKNFPQISGTGHIMKLRYTPSQINVLAVEEDAHPENQKIKKFQNLSKMPVVVGTLHSQLAPTATALKKLGKGKIKIAYLMNDTACLPIVLSNLVTQLKKKNIIDATITYGQAFGGDLEAINIYTALIAAKEIAEADVSIVTMGLGSVGTGTKYGFGGIVQGEIINSVNILDGLPVAIPRISFADKRLRHYGISHHTLTALGEIALTPAFIGFPILDKEKMDYVKKQLQDYPLMKKHIIKFVNGEIALSSLKEYKIDVTTMGREIKEDKEFFLACGAAAKIAYELTK